MQEIAPAISFHDTEFAFPNSSTQIHYSCEGMVRIWNPVENSAKSLIHVTFLEVESGGGKTTLMEMMNSYLSKRTMSSTIRISPDPTWNHCVAYIPQKPNIVRHWKVADLAPSKNPAFFHALHLPENTASSRRRIADFSGGQVSRIFVASALHRLSATGAHANYLLLDEAFEGIDATLLKDSLIGIEKAWRDTNPGKHLFILLVTHLDLQLVIDDSLAIDTKRITLRKLGTFADEDIEIIRVLMVEQSHAPSREKPQ